MYFNTLRANSSPTSVKVRPNQWSNCFFTACGLNLSHSNPRAAPPVALVCPVEVCPIRSSFHRPAGKVAAVRTPEFMYPVKSMISCRCRQSFWGSSVSVVADATRHTKPAFPSHWLRRGPSCRRNSLILRFGFHLAASMSSLPGSVPSGLQVKRKYRAVTGGRA